MNQQVDLFSAAEVIAPMMPEEARRCIGEIKRGIINVRRLLWELDERKGWEALGYVSFRECIETEFGYKKSYIYELRASAEVERNLLDGGFSSALEEPIPQRHLAPLMRLSPDQQREAWREAVDTAPNGKVTGPHVQSVVDRMTAQDDGQDDEDNDDPGPPDRYYVILDEWGYEERLMVGDDEEIAVVKRYPTVAANHAETEGDDWCTPTEYVEAVRSVLGVIDLDPATNQHGQEVVKATHYYTKQDDGLFYEWHGRVFLNPPYSVPLIDKFTSKLITEYYAGNVTEAIVLTNNSTETQWFQSMLAACNLVCFPARRLKFWKNGDDVFATRQGQAFFYFGNNQEGFNEAFSEFGTVLTKA